MIEMYYIYFMRNFIFISPNFPETYYMFVKALKENGFNVLGVGDASYDELHYELKQNLTEYYRCNLENFNEVYQALAFFSAKYGPIEYLESNNEYWLRQDARLRDAFNINGMRLADIDRYQRKSKMKECFQKAGVKVARFIVINDTNKKDVNAFFKEVGFPLFAKPDIGVGAHGSYKINNNSELQNFIKTKPQGVDYIIEQYVHGEIISYDGVSNSKAEVIFADNEHFPPSISDIVHSNGDMFYYCAPTIPKELDKIGRNVVKAFNIQNRFFHIEFFKLDSDITGLGKKNDIVALEANLRAPGGYTPDLINYARSVNIYKIWADSLAYDRTYEYLEHPKYYAGCASRRDNKNYFYTHQQILEKYHNNICKEGRYPYILADDLGDTYYMGKFLTKSEMLKFRDYVQKSAK